MHAARGWLPTAIGMLLLVPPWSGLLVHAVAQSRTHSEHFAPHPNADRATSIRLRRGYGATSPKLDERRRACQNR